MWRYHGKPILIGKITVFTDAGAFDTAQIDDGHTYFFEQPVGLSMSF